MPTAIGRNEAQRLISEERAQLVEVLPESEFEESHIEGARNIPLKRLDRDRVGELNAASPIIVYCHDCL